MNCSIETTPLISIIIPIYKCEKFIRDCLNSVVNQTYRNLEIILVDDGSPDSSGAICDEYLLTDGRIKVIHKPNGGVSSARNCGLDNASGEFVMFVDSDDMIHDDMCFHLYSLMTDECDWVVSEYYASTLFELCDKAQDVDSVNICKYDKSSDAFSEMVRRKIFNCPYAKLFRKKIIGDQRYRNDITLGEDLLFNLDYLKKISGKTAVSSYQGYMYYTANTNSITNSFRESNFDVALLLHESLRKFSLENNLRADAVKQIDKDLVIDTMGYLQGLYFSSYSKSFKRDKSIACINTVDVEECCKQEYDFNLVNRKLLAYIRDKREKAIGRFFKIKKILIKLLK